ncbi:PhzF family phenazine biosynthesis protein [Paracidobacterium acidisoli]|uniref:PhzF family phenazine biosynthesis protein n=1 Tax=Paracidobacterium acidisoli TaxID=2303751 RepID=A0A372IPB3_9BACT|nr:PhzF family phenazine biosynthesis protein [Paracidobacterium acidisoli]MBT9331048.1 PhzF family phenazine biosynthesis protein [Paracidobacterium acidisoli]
MREIEYRLCDVFTETRLAGNQLAVFLDGGALTGTQMQALAKETNLSETTFICRREAAVEAERGVRVRIFTTQEELPFAGHPTLGTAATIRETCAEYAHAETVRLDLNAGIVPVRFSPERSTGASVFGEMTQPEPVFGAYHQSAQLAAILGLAVEDLHPEWKPQTVSTGMPFCIVPLRSVEALGRLSLHAREADDYLRSTDAKFIYAIAPGEEGTWRARMQFYNGEDPATGSAAGCATAWLVAHDLAASDNVVHLRQGIEMGRPSGIYGRAKLSDGRVSEVRIAGSTVSVAKGRFFLE